MGRAARVRGGWGGGGRPPLFFDADDVLCRNPSMCSRCARKGLSVLHATVETELIVVSAMCSSSLVTCKRVCDDENAPNQRPSASWRNDRARAGSSKRTECRRFYIRKRRKEVCRVTKRIASATQAFFVSLFLGVALRPREKTALFFAGSSVGGKVVRCGFKPHIMQSCFWGPSTGSGHREW